MLKITFCTFTAFFIFLKGFSQGDLMIMPKRLVFDGNKRSEKIHLINRGKDSATYAISFIQYRMTENGSFEEITEPSDNDNFASDYLRYYPRRVTLGPNEAQTIRVQTKRTNSLEDGEYRSHIYFRAVEDQTPIGKKNSSVAQDKISIQIKTVFGISIPLIIRKGADSTKITISDVFINQKKEEPEISITLNREGNMSVYGDLSITHISPEENLTEIGMIKGISVYTPNDKRIISIPLKNIDKVDLTTGQLRIEYQEKEGELMAETFYNLK